MFNVDNVMPKLQSTGGFCDNSPKSRQRNTSISYLLELIHTRWMGPLGVDVALNHGAFARVNPSSGRSPQLSRSLGLGLLQCGDVDRHNGAGVVEILTASEAGVWILNTSISAC